MADTPHMSAEEKLKKAQEHMREAHRLTEEALSEKGGNAARDIEAKVQSAGQEAKEQLEDALGQAQQAASQAERTIADDLRNAAEDAKEQLSNIDMDAAKAKLGEIAGSVGDAAGKAAGVIARSAKIIGEDLGAGIAKAFHDLRGSGEKAQSEDVPDAQPPAGDQTGADRATHEDSGEA